MTLIPLETDNALSVTSYLSQARDWLATCVEMTGPEQIAAAKAEIATAAEATKQLRLSKEIQLDAQEMVRRAEYALGKAIRKGQAEGTVRTRGQHGSAYDRWNGVHRETKNSTKPSPTDYAPPHELNGKTGQEGIYAMSDDVTPDDFDDAIDEAKAEGNLSRANVVRKIKDIKDGGPETRKQRADKIAELAAQGLTSRQMADQVGVSEISVRQIARDNGVDIPADRVTAKRHRLNAAHVLDNVTDAIEAAAYSLRQIDLSELGPEESRTAVDSLTSSMKSLAKEVKKIKESL